MNLMRMISTLVFIMMVILMFCTVTSDFKIIFQATPDTIEPVLNNALELRCAIGTDGTTQQTPAIVGNGAISVNSAASPYNANVAYILYIAISKKKHSGVEHIANVSAYHPPTASMGVSKVEGDTSASPIATELGYLSVVYDQPTADQSGNYTCQVTAGDSSFQSIHLTQDIHVMKAIKTMDDVTKYISQLHMSNMELQNSTLELQKSYNALQNSSFALEETIHDLQQQVVAKETDIQKLQKEAEDTKNELAILQQVLQTQNQSIHNVKAQNIQHGWHYGCTTRHNRITFRKPYEKPPIVFVSVTSNIHYHSSTSSSFTADAATYFETGPKQVNETGFNLWCHVNSIPKGVGFGWLAIDA